MSVEAITWALKQDVGHSSAKFVLVVLANAANAVTGCAFVSVAYVSEATGQDRKTVLSNMRRLQEKGYIKDTGDRVGKTGQVVVYAINPGFEDDSDVDSKESQKRNSTENGTVPKTDSNSTVFPAKESRFSAKESQKRDTEPSLTVKSNRKSNRQPTNPMPDDFGISERVKLWAAQKGHTRLPEHLEVFRAKCKAKGYAYADWDSAFMEAIREDWAKLGSPQKSTVNNGSSPASQRAL